MAESMEKAGINQLGTDYSAIGRGTVSETRTGRVPEMLDGIQEQIAKLEEGLRIVLSPEPEDERKANPMPPPSQSELAVKLDYILTRLLNLNKRLDL